MCRRPLQLWGFGYSLTDRLVHLSLEHDLQPFTIRHVVVSPHPSLPGPDWRCLWYGSFNIQRYMWEYILLLTFINIVDSGPRFARGVLGAWEGILISTVCCRLLQFGLLVHVYRHHLVGCCCAIGRHLWVLLLSPQPPSRRCFRGGFRATSSTTVLYLRGVSSWQHHHDGSCVGGIKNDNKQINVTWTLYMITWSLSIIIVRALICGVVWWGNVNITQMVYYVIILLYEGYDLTQLIADGNSVLGIQVIIYPYQSWIVSLPATDHFWLRPGDVKHSVGG